MPNEKILRVHIDTEFTDFVNSDVISLGMIADNGSEFYFENLDHIKAWCSDWVKENIYPMLNDVKFGKTRKALAASAWEWIAELECDGIIISYDHRVDMEILMDLFGGIKHPKIFDHQNIIENIYYDCDRIVKESGGGHSAYDSMVARVISTFERDFQSYFETTGETQHYAISDARANRFAYNNIVREFGIRY